MAKKAPARKPTSKAVVTRAKSGAVIAKNQDAIEKADGWNNIMTGLGRQGADKRMAADYEYERMEQRECEDLYAADDMAAKIVDTLPEEVVREGFDFKHDGEIDNQLQTDLDSILDEKGIYVTLQEGMQWAAMYGGAGTVLGINDGKPADEPVDWDNVQGLDFLNNLTRFELKTEKVQSDPSLPGYGVPELYRIQPAVANHAAALGPDRYIHADRILRWDGIKLPRRLQIENDYWGMPILSRVVGVLRNFNTAHDSAASLLADFSQAVYKLKNLTEMLAMEKDDLVQKRLALVDRTRSVVNAIILEEGEEFDRKVTSLTGLPETLKMINSRLVQASGMPHTLLLGESPSGLGATGDSEKGDWHSKVSRKQTLEFIPNLTKVIRCILLSKEGPTKGVEPENWRMEARPLEQETMTEILANRKAQADIDVAYINASVLSPDEVALARFGGDDFSFDTKLVAERNEEDIEEDWNQEEPEIDPATGLPIVTEEDPEAEDEDDDAEEEDDEA